MSKWEDIEKALLKDPATKREFDRLAPRYAVISEIISARLKHKMTQADVAEKIGTVGIFTEDENALFKTIADSYIPLFY